MPLSAPSPSHTHTTHITDNVFYICTQQTTRYKEKYKEKRRLATERLRLQQEILKRKRKEQAEMCVYLSCQKVSQLF